MIDKHPDTQLQGKVTPCKIVTTIHKSIISKLFFGHQIYQKLMCCVGWGWFCFVCVCVLLLCWLGHFCVGCFFWLFLVGWFSVCVFVLFALASYYFIAFHSNAVESSLKDAVIHSLVSVLLFGNTVSCLQGNSGNPWQNPLSLMLSFIWAAEKAILSWRDLVHCKGMLKAVVSAREMYVILLKVDNYVW